VDSAGNVLVGGSSMACEFWGEEPDGTGSKNGFVLKLPGQMDAAVGHQVVSSASSAVRRGCGWRQQRGHHRLVRRDGESGRRLAAPMPVQRYFSAKYSSTGTYVWANHYGGIGADSGTRGRDAAGNVFVTGAFQFPPTWRRVAHDRRYLLGVSDETFLGGAYQWTKALGTREPSKEPG